MSGKLGPQLIQEFLRLRQKVGELELFKAEALRTCEAFKKFKIFFSNLSDIAYICDAEGNILYLSDSFERLTGRRPDEFMGRPFAPLFDENNLKKAFDAYQKTLKGESPEYELYFKDTGVLCEYRSAPMKDEEGRVIGVMGIARDITGKRSSEEELHRYIRYLENIVHENSREIKNLNERLAHESAEREKAAEALKIFGERYVSELQGEPGPVHNIFLGAMEQFLSAILITDIKGVIEYANPVFEKLTGYCASRARGMQIREILTAETPVDNDELWIRIFEGRTWSGTMKNRKKDGSVSICIGHAAPIKAGNGHITHFVFCAGSAPLYGTQKDSAD